MAISLYPSTEMPVGAVILWTTTVAPVGWLLCDGTQYVGTTYPALYELIGVTFGSITPGEFQVPDLRGRVPVGKSGSTSIGAVNAHLLANHTHSITHNHTMNDQSASHSHNAGNQTASHTHNYTKPNSGSAAATSNQSVSHSHNLGNQTASHTHNTTGQNTSTTGAATNTAGDIILSYIIKAF